MDEIYKEQQTYGTQEIAFRYQAYMLRAWTEIRQSEPDKWHFSVEKVGSKEPLGFADLTAVFEFLHNAVVEK